MTETLREFLIRVDEAVVVHFEEHGGIDAEIVLVREDGQFGTMKLPPGADKDEIMQDVRDILQEIGAVRVVFLDEAWMVAGESEDIQERVEAHFREHATLENFEGRKEVITYTAECREEGSLIAERVIVRTADAKPSLGPLEIFANDVTEGRIVGLLPGARSKRELN